MMQNKKQDPEVVIRALRQQVEDLKFELEEVRRTLGTVSPAVIGGVSEIDARNIANVRDAYGMPMADARFLVQLSTGRTKDHFALIAGMNSKALDGNFTKVMICRVRKQLNEVGSEIRITTMTGSGYRITAGLDELKDAMEGWVVLKEKMQIVRARKV